ncbi:hypothetical protein KY290_023997 [Solanum tuberosum]|uniref:Uncharacterized protein n=1 Tax=Solanum tuberosum TaxID=4113 RepID=A0ABQ7URG3_SOLTU|nr:hypothetical protein KY284_022900 [Solanum tuberosum]KAH0753727.1 hypothetical protein KY290_023997 [Solanum tuberosum]
MIHGVNHSTRRHTRERLRIGPVRASPFSRESESTESSKRREIRVHPVLSTRLLPQSSTISYSLFRDSSCLLSVTAASDRPRGYEIEPRKGSRTLEQSETWIHPFLFQNWAKF